MNDLRFGKYCDISTGSFLFGLSIATRAPWDELAEIVGFPLTETR
jgi:hypothetical protein